MRPFDADAANDLGERIARHAPRLGLLLVHLAGPLVRRHVDVDDLAHETMLRALASASSAPGPERGDGELWRWLSTIARHVVVDRARTLRARRIEGRVMRLGHDSRSSASRPCFADRGAGRRRGPPRGRAAAPGSPRSHGSRANTAA